MMNKSLFSSKTGEWSMPQDLFDKLDKIYGFDIDVCATKENAKCPVFYTKEDDGLNQTWKGVCWMNPPYGRKIGDWVSKAYRVGMKGSTVVALLPARTDTKWFHDYIYQQPGVTVTFLKGRLKFGGGKHAAPFPSMLVLFNRRFESLS